MNVASFPAPALPKPLFDCEGEMRAVVDRLTILEMALETPGEISAERARALSLVIGETLTDAMKVQTAWEASFGDQA
jgi:hypothetical protein